MFVARFSDSSFHSSARNLSSLSDCSLWVSIMFLAFCDFFQVQMILTFVLSCVLLCARICHALCICSMIGAGGAAWLAVALSLCAADVPWPSSSSADDSALNSSHHLLSSLEASYHALISVGILGVASLTLALVRLVGAPMMMICLLSCVVFSPRYAWLLFFLSGD